MLTSAAAPASAISIANEARSNVVFDAMVMRPLGLGAFLMGSALFTISLPLLAVSRPEDIGTPWRILVAAPAKYVWGDPLGEH
jgi:hypothetical protein